MEFCYKKKQRMNDVLICCGYSYNLKTVSKAINQITKEPLTQRWICLVRDCYATVSVENNAIIKIDGLQSTGKSYITWKMYNLLQLLALKLAQIMV